MSDLPDYEKVVSCCTLFIKVKANQTKKIFVLALCVKG